MRLLSCLLLIICLALPAAAQTEDDAQARRFDDGFVQADSLTLDSIARDGLEGRLIDPPAAVLPLRPAGYYPYFGGYGLGGYGAWDGFWQLHKGFNASFSLSVGGSFGKNAIRGAAFGQSAAFAYVLPVTKRFSVAAGVYAQNFDWGRYHQTDVGFAALVNYQVNDRVNVFAYASHSFLPRATFKSSRPCLPYLWQEPRTRIGGGAEFKIGEHAKIGVSVEHASY